MVVWRILRQKRGPEYCEYVADLIRTIIQSQSYNADETPIPPTSRRHFPKAINTRRYRTNAKDYSYSADTKRKIIQDHVFAGKRGVIVLLPLYLAKILKSYIRQTSR